MLRNIGLLAQGVWIAGVGILFLLSVDGTNHSPRRLLLENPCELLNPAPTNALPNRPDTLASSSPDGQRSRIATRRKLVIPESRRDRPSITKSAQQQPTGLVTVLDASGAAISDMEVTIYNEYAHGNPTRRHRYWRGTTNQLGQVPIYAYAQSRVRRRLKHDPAATAVFKTSICDLNYGAFLFRLEELRDGHYVFRAPLTGSFKVRVTDPDGNPSSSAEVHLMGTDPLIDDPPEELGRVITDSSGQASFPHVLAGLKVHLVASSRNQQWASVKTPTWIVQPRKFRRPANISFTHPATTLSGRLVDQRGRPVRGASFKFLRTSNGIAADWGGRCVGTYPFAGMQTSVARTDAEGYYELSLDAPIEIGRHELIVTLRDRDRATGSASFLNHQRRVGEDLDLDYIVLHPPPSKSPAGQALAKREP